MIVRPSDGHVLILRRSRRVKKAGSWGFPGGGVEPGEDELRAAFREAAEEAGDPPVRPVPIEPHWQAVGPFFAFATFAAELEDERWKPRLNPESDRYLWAAPMDFPSPAMPGTREAAADLLRRMVKVRPGRRRG